MRNHHVCNDPAKPPLATLSATTSGRFLPFPSFPYRTLLTSHLQGVREISIFPTGMMNQSTNGTVDYYFDKLAAFLEKA